MASSFWIGILSLVPYPHCILITSSHKIKLWEEPATDEAVGMQRGYEQIGAWSTFTRGGGRVAKDDCLCGVQDDKTTLQAERPNRNNITDATSTGENGGMLWNNSMFCNELINYAVRIV